MRTPSRKAVRDFRQELPRTILVVAAIAAGISGFVAVLGSYAVLTRELNRGYLATNPASMTVRTARIDQEVLRELRANPGVRDVEARRVVAARIKSARTPWRNAVLFVIPDFRAMRVSRIERERGSWPPATGELLVERDAFQVARVRIGDDVVVRMNDGLSRTLRVSGAVHDVGQAQARMENVVYGYITPATLTLLTDDASLDQLKIVVSGDGWDERRIRSVAASVEASLERGGRAVTRVDIPTPGKHPHADIMGLLMLALAAFGLFVMLLSGIIVFNLLTALMAAQVRQIGVMKALGGTQPQIARIYLLQALLLGVAATVVAIPAGIAGCRSLCRAMAVFLNFDITSFAIPAWVLLLTALVGIAIPLAAAALPVRKGIAISVREALADFGVAGSSFGTTAFDRFVAGIGGMTRPVLFAVRNGFRRRPRLALTVVTLAAGGLFFMTALNVRGSMIRTLDHLFDGRKHDVAVTIAGMARVEDVNRVVRETTGIRRAEPWIATQGGMTATARPSQHATGGIHGGGSGNMSDRFTIFALPARTTMFEPEMMRGRWLRQRGEIVVNSALLVKDPQMRVGNRVTIPMGPGSVNFLVTGVVREPFSPPVAYITRDLFDEMPDHAGMTNHLRIALTAADVASVDRFKSAFEERLSRAGVKVAAMTSKSDSRFGFDQHMVMIYVALIIMSALIAGVGALGLSTTMTLNVLERRREIGVLRALGAPRRSVAAMLIAEGCVAGGLAWLVATLGAWPVGKSVGNLLVTMMFKTPLDFSFEIKGALLWLIASISLSAIASFVAAWQATHCPVREALGYE